MTKSDDVTKLDMLFGVLQRGVAYNFVEFILVFTFLIMELRGGIWMPLLWVSFGLTVLWVLLSSTEDAQDEAKIMVRDRELFITDFLTGGVFLTGLAILTWDYGWQFPAIFAVAVGQNLRYTALSMMWLMDERKLKNE